ncbi:sulfur carrier protein ThiS [uncultured Aquimarina sp.]|uniref:sulfur carrier protein ThiS n=1 Tax=uncultured Aquimarina sp. TaxID=575652 RepID=UPI00261476E7|nr:sulfur carrier protein ThiS [uncultured Aquimarina sp.]
MTINVNNQEQIVSANSSIESLLEHLCLSKDGIAIAVNNEIITKSKWSQTLIQGQDNITIIQATQGG